MSADDKNLESLTTQMTQRPVPQPGVLDIAAYVPGKGAPHPAAAKLSSNESPLGASPLAMEAAQKAVEDLSGYPDGSANELRTALAKAHGLEASRIVIGAGSDELLNLIAHAYLGQGDEAVISEYGFLVYPIATLGTGAKPVFAKDKDYTVDVDAMLAAVTDKTKVVWLANPNNPTGTWLSDAEVRRLHAGLRSDILLVVDNAYAEYVTADDFTVGTDLVREAENVVMVRTFSKVGLAALRVGWMYGPDAIIDAINRVRGPFNVTSVGIKAAVAATQDEAFNQTLKTHNAKWREWLTSELQSNQLRVIPSQGNFILVLFPQEAGKTAQDANEALTKADLIVRDVSSYGLKTALRISIGTEKEMRGVAKVLKDFMA